MMTTGATGLRFSGLMKLAIVSLLLAACSEPLDVPPMAGAYQVSWTCASATCSSPLSTVTRAEIEDADDAAVIRWERGVGNVIATHEGERSEAMPECADVPAGSDSGVARAGYSLCFDETGLWANPGWGESYWVVDLAPL